MSKNICTVQCEKAVQPVHHFYPRQGESEGCEPLTAWPNRRLVQGTGKANVLLAPGLLFAIIDGFTHEGCCHLQLKKESVRLRGTCS